MDRFHAYQDLVSRRKTHVFPPLLLNPAEIDEGCFDSDHLGPWSLWQGDLHAEVVVVGQDWGNITYFRDNQGIDDDREQTCKNLRTLAKVAGWELGTPHVPNPQKLFFTNAVLGIRAKGGKSGTPLAALVDDSLPFLVDLLNIIQPKAVVSLGTSAYRACRIAMYGRGRDPRIPLGASLKTIYPQSPVVREGKPAWFPFYHCSPNYMERNHPLELQIEDWKGLGNWLRTATL